VVQNLPSQVVLLQVELQPLIGQTTGGTTGVIMFVAFVEFVPDYLSLLPKLTSGQALTVQLFPVQFLIVQFLSPHDGAWLQVAH